MSQGSTQRGRQPLQEGACSPNMPSTVLPPHRAPTPEDRSGAPSCPSRTPTSSLGSCLSCQQTLLLEPGCLKLVGINCPCRST